MHIKCVCGYEYHEGVFEEDTKYVSKGDWGVLVGDKPFRQIKGDFRVRAASMWDEDSDIQLLMCPKCGTIKGE